MKLPPVRQELMIMAGGLDQTTPTLSLPPGFVRRGANFQCSINGGYSRIDGYWRFDGRPNPADAAYLAVTCELTATVAVGDTVEGSTSGTTGKVILIPDENTLVLTRVVGEFDIAGEALEVSSTPVGTMSDASYIVADGYNDSLYRYTAAMDYRADIGAVPGAGPIRGIQFLNNTVYAWRNNVGETAMEIYKSTSSGWTKVNLGWRLSFSTGTVAIQEGQTVTGATSGATGVVARVVLQSGSWGAGTAAGVLILSATTGTFSGENLNVSASPVAATTGGASAITLNPNGRVQSVIGNFGAGARRIYGADGVNKGFEFDGTVYVPITTGMADDTPDCVAILKEHLFFSFGSSLQFSALGLPYQWSVVIGAGEIAMGDTITVLQLLPGDQTNGAMAIYTTRNTSILYGSSSANFVKSEYNINSGAVPYTGANLDQPYVLSEHGVTRLSTTLDFGNFSSSSITMNIRKYINSRKSLATAATVNTEKGQYRVFFSDGYGLYITVVNRKVVGMMPVSFNHPVMCACSGETSDDGVEIQYFGSDDGYVYRLDDGTSFDGDPIAATVMTVFNSVKSPRTLKSFLKASVEITGSSYNEFEFGYVVGYNSQDVEQPDNTSALADLRPSYWDEFTWDEFIWDGRDIAPVDFRLEGSSENVAMIFSNNSALFKEFTINSVMLHYTIRRNLR